MDLSKFIQSKKFKIVLLVIAGLVVIFFIFGAGMMVGFKKANFSYKWGENYHRNFGGPRGGFFEDFRGRDLIDAHGVSGQIIKFDGSTLVIKGRDEVEKIVLVREDTIIRRSRDTIATSDLNVNDVIVVIGDPNEQGQIEAKFIRLMPPPPLSLPSPVRRRK